MQASASSVPEGVVVPSASEGEPGSSGGRSGAQRRAYADASNRLVAYLIDAVILTVLSFVAAIVISVLFGPVVTLDPAADPQVAFDRGLALANAVVATVISLAYFAGGWSVFAGSPGQRLLGLRVGAEDDGRRITFAHGFVRWLFIGLPIGLEGMLSTQLTGLGDAALIVAVALWFGFLLISIARDPAKQGLHDRVAHTVVTKRNRPVTWQAPSDHERGAVAR